MDDTAIAKRLIKQLDAGLTLRQAAKEIGVPARKAYYLSERGMLGDYSAGDELPQPTEKQVRIAEEAWLKNYSIDSIAFQTKAMPWMVIGWKKNGWVQFPARERPSQGFKFFWCRNPEHRKKDPGLHQCVGCIHGSPCDARKSGEFEPWREEKDRW